MTSGGPPEKDKEQDVVNANNKPTTITPSVAQPNVEQSLSATLSATGIGPSIGADNKGQTPMEAVHSSPAAASGGLVSAPPTSAELQALAKKNFATITASQLPLGQGNFKRVYRLTDKVAIASSIHKTDSAQKPFEEECVRLKTLAAMGLPALPVYSDVFDIDGRPAFLVEAIPDHTFIDGKDPKTNISTVLPSMLLNVKIPATEAWFRYKDKIISEVKQKLSDPKALSDAQKKAGILLQQLDGIVKTLEANDAIIVDLQLVVDPSGKITIIDPLDIVRQGKQLGEFTTLDGKPIEKNDSFTQSLNNTYGMLKDMRAFCRNIMASQEPQKQLSSLLNIGASAQMHDPEFTPLGAKSSLGSTHRPNPLSSYDSKAATVSHDNFGATAAGPRRPLGLGLGIGRSKPITPPAPQSGTWKKPGLSSRAMVFSKMPDAIPLHPTGTDADKNPTANQSASAKQEADKTETTKETVEHSGAAAKDINTVENTPSTPPSDPPRRPSSPSQH